MCKTIGHAFTACFNEREALLAIPTFRFLRIPQGEQLSAVGMDTAPADRVAGSSRRPVLHVRTWGPTSATPVDSLDWTIILG